MTVQDDLLQVIAELELRRAQLHIRLMQEALHENEPDLIGQTASELGRRNHIDAVRRRIHEKQGGAWVSPNGRRFLLSPEAYREELDRVTARAERRVAKARVPVESSGDAEEAELEERLLAKMRAR
jgi:hypothetical protein